VRLSGLSATFAPDGGCVIREKAVVGGALALAFAAAASVPLIFRTDLYDGPSNCLWLFRVLFCGGFGWMGLLAVTFRLEGRFDPAAGTFTYLARSLFGKKRFEGPLKAVHCVRLKKSVRGGSRLGDHLRWEMHTYTLSVVFEGRDLPLLSKRVEPTNARSHNTIDGMLPEELAQRLAQLIQCPLERVEK
jgi:hypothetical protein